MLSRTVALLICASFAFASAPFAISSSACEEARAHLRDEIDASGGALTLPVAQALKATVDACPPIVSTSVPTLQPNTPPPPPPADARLPARQCGFTSDEVAFHDPDSQITTWTMYPGNADPYYEAGRADVTYVPASDSTTYEAHGPRNGLLAQSDGAGTAFLYGIPIPATRAQATSGCPPSGGDLCWAQALVEVHVPFDALRIYSVIIQGEANVCA